MTHIVASCKRLGIPCDRELLLSIHCPDTCPVLGTPIWFERGRGRRPAQSTASFDRIDPAGGYVAGNVVIKSMRANQMKSNASPEEEFLYAQYVMAEHAHRLGP